MDKAITSSFEQVVGAAFTWCALKAAKNTNSFKYAHTEPADNEIVPDYAVIEGQAIDKHSLSRMKLILDSMRGPRHRKVAVCPLAQRSDYQEQ